MAPGIAGPRWARGAVGLSGSGSSGNGDDAREAARQIGDQLLPLVRRSRASGFDFLAYLLAMALKESRRLSGK
jgi:hypothetical protein